AEALAAVGQLRAGRRPPRLGAAEKSKPHASPPKSPSLPPGAERAGVRWGIPERLPSSPPHPPIAAAMGPSLSALKGGEGLLELRVLLMPIGRLLIGMCDAQHQRFGEWRGGDLQ